MHTVLQMKSLGLRMLSTKRVRGIIFEVIDLFVVWTMIVALQVYTCAKIYQTLCFKHMRFTLCQLCLIKPGKNKRNAA